MEFSKISEKISWKKFWNWIVYCDWSFKDGILLFLVLLGICIRRVSFQFQNFPQKIAARADFSATLGKYPIFINFSKFYTVIRSPRPEFWLDWVEMVFSNHYCMYEGTCKRIKRYNNLLLQTMPSKLGDFHVFLVNFIIFPRNFCFILSNSCDVAFHY